MHITSKGQVTIPQKIRNRLGLMQNTEVEFEVVGQCARIRKVLSPSGKSSRGQRAIRALRGTGDIRMTTDEIMALTRGEGERIVRKK